MALALKIKPLTLKTTKQALPYLNSFSTSATFDAVVETLRRNLGTKTVKHLFPFMLVYQYMRRQGAVKLSNPCMTWDSVCHTIVFFQFHQN